MSNKKEEHQAVLRLNPIELTTVVLSPTIGKGAYFIMVGVNSRESNNTIFVEHTMVGRGATLILGRSEMQAKSIRFLSYSWVTNLRCSVSK